MDIIYTKPIYLHTLLSIFYHQRDNRSTITEITTWAARPTNYVDITKTAEYAYVLRAIQDLTKLKILKKVKPAKKDKFKTHFRIDLAQFTNMVISFYKSLPMDWFSRLDPYRKNLMEGNRHIENVVGIFFTSISATLLRSKGGRFLNTLESTNLRDILFIFVDKVIAHEFPRKHDELDNPILLTIAKEKNREKKGYLMFISMLIDIERKYFLYAKVDAWSRETLLYNRFILGKMKFEKMDKIDKSWAQNVHDIINKKKDINSITFLD